MSQYQQHPTAQVQYTLSAETTFNSRGGTFNYEQFYNDLMSYLNDPMCKVDTEELIKWWDQQVEYMLFSHADLTHD